MGNQFLEGSWSAEYDDMFEKTFIILRLSLKHQYMDY
jgi:hypothetical protein